MLNIKPYPSLVLKLEADRIKFDDMVDLMPDGTTRTQSNGAINVYTAQVAVTF